jgi:hypothetical protein
MFAKWIIKNSSGSVNKMTKNVIAQTIWVYTKELGMGLEPPQQWRCHPQNPLFLRKTFAE